MTREQWVVANNIAWNDPTMLDDDGLDPIQALVCDAAAAEPSRMVHEGGEYYAERIIKRAIAQGTLVLAVTPPQANNQ